MNTLISTPNNLIVGDDSITRMRDTDLAVMLGYEQPRQIRELIGRHAATLADKYGQLFCRTVRQNTKGRPATEYHLNEKQCVYLIIKSETPNAADLTVQIVEVFVAFNNGKLTPTTKESLALAVAAPAAAVFLSPELLAAVDSMVERRVGERCSPLESKLRDLMTLVRTMHEYKHPNPETARILCWLNGQSVPKDVLQPLPAPAGKGGAR